jgi:hypothetical protein
MLEGVRSPSAKPGINVGPQSYLLGRVGDHTHMPWHYIDTVCIPVGQYRTEVGALRAGATSIAPDSGYIRILAGPPQAAGGLAPLGGRTVDAGTALSSPRQA